MSNLMEYAKYELKMGGFVDKDDKDNVYERMIANSVMELIRVFINQKHSGRSADMIIDLFSRLAKFKNITPLTFKDDEWQEVENNFFQNKRNLAVFKNGKNGRPYYLKAYTVTIVIPDEDEEDEHEHEHILKGIERLRTENGEYIERCYIKDPTNMPTIEIVLKAYYDKSDSTKYKWLVDPIIESQLEKLKEYYDIVLRRLIP